MLTQAIDRSIDRCMTVVNKCSSIVLCGIIVTTTVPLLRESALILLQTVPTHLNVSLIQEKLLKSVSQTRENDSIIFWSQLIWFV